MAVWWVFQNNSYDRSRAGGYLWAPLVDKVGNRKSHWETMAQVQPGDIVLSSVGRRIVATSVAKSGAYEAEQPDPQDSEFWTGRGRRVDVAYADLPAPLPVEELSDLFEVLSEEGGPLAVDGRGKQGYLFAVNPTAARMVLERLGRTADIDQIVASAIEADGPGPVTTADRTQRVRIGQAQFRDGVMQLWDRKCSVSGVFEPRLLIASHIKSWRLANDFERLDPNNGLLLEARFDRLFDSGLITFDSDGLLKVSPEVCTENREALGLSDGLRLRKVRPETAIYLEFHRDNVFRI